MSAPEIPSTERPAVAHPAEHPAEHPVEHPAEHVEVSDRGRVVAWADVRDTDAPGSVVAAVHVESGHRPVGTGARLVDAVLDTRRVGAADHLTTSAPRGESEVTERVRERLDDVRTRAAGASTIVDGTVPHR